RRCTALTRANRHHPRCTRSIALKVSYVLNVPATVAFTIERVAPGRLVKGRCRVPTRANRHHRRCTRVAARAGFMRAGRTGANSFLLPTRIGKLKLGPGSFLLLATPSASGVPGRQQRTTFLTAR